jgi:autotransporter-associated beta strand protein
VASTSSTGPPTRRPTALRHRHAEHRCHQDARGNHRQHHHRQRRSPSPTTPPSPRSPAKIPHLHRRRQPRCHPHPDGGNRQHGGDRGGRVLRSDLRQRLRHHQGRRGQSVLSGTNTYTGDTTVNAGVLALTGTPSPMPARSSSMAGTVDLTNTETVATLFFGATRNPPATTAPAACPPVRRSPPPASPAAAP